MLCCATGALGFGFGATVTTLNTLVERLAADRADAAVLTLNALLGVGTALAPALVALFAALGVWWALPLLTAIFAAALLVSLAASTSALGPAAAAVVAGAGLPRRFWLYAAAALLYGIVETLCGNWATLYLSTQRAVPAANASYALTAFWLMVTLGRVALAASGRWLPAKWTYVALPLALAVVFQLVAHADGALIGTLAFGAAGLACSGVLAAQHQPRRRRVSDPGGDHVGRIDRLLSDRLRRRRFRRRPSQRAGRRRLFHGVLDW